VFVFCVRRSLELSTDDRLISSVLASVYGNVTSDQALAKLLSSEAFSALRALAQRWQGLLGKTIIREIDKQCTNVYDLYPDRYVDFAKMPRVAADTLQSLEASS